MAASWRRPAGPGFARAGSPSGTTGGAGAHPQVGPELTRRATGVTGETADGVSLGKIGRIIDALRHERYRFSPARRRGRSWPTESAAAADARPVPAGGVAARR